MAKWKTTVGCLICLCLGSLSCRTASDSAEAEGVIANDGLLPKADWRRLLSAGWQERVGDELGLWVCVSRQRLMGIQGGRERFILACSTAAQGTGNRENSHRTPLGWHVIAERFGQGLPAGAIFHERKYTGQIWKKSHKTTKDEILSRILWLRGLEHGINQGPGIDSHARFIYIHGTPAEDRLGTPASMGCIRLSNQDVIQLFDRTQTGTPVLITEQ